MAAWRRCARAGSSTRSGIAERPLTWSGPGCRSSASGSRCPAVGRRSGTPTAPLGSRRRSCATACWSASSPSIEGSEDFDEAQVVDAIVRTDYATPVAQRRTAAPPPARSAATSGRVVPALPGRVPLPLGATSTTTPGPSVWQVGRSGDRSDCRFVMFESEEGEQQDASSTRCAGAGGGGRADRADGVQRRSARSRRSARRRWRTAWRPSTSPTSRSPRRRHPMRRPSSRRRSPTWASSDRRSRSALPRSRRPTTRRRRPLRSRTPGISTTATRTGRTRATRRSRTSRATKPSRGA